LTYLYAVLALMIAVIIHEFGHAFEMRRRGVPIKRFGIGWPIGPIGIKIPLGKNLPPLYIHPLLIGAYVEPESEGDIKKLRYFYQNEISAAGVFWNMATAGVLIAALGFINGSFVTPLIVAAVTAVVFYFRSWFAQILPLIGIAFIGLNIYFLVGVESNGEAAVMGPIGIVNLLSSLSFWQALILISLALGSTNMIPIPPLDGGRVLIVSLEKFKVSKRVIEVISVVGFILIIVLIIFTTGSDITRIFFKESLPNLLRI